MFTAGHLGTPGLGAYCAAGWALEGFCDVQPPLGLAVGAALLIQMAMI
jgi:hypothetical protein